MKRIFLTLLLLFFLAFISCKNQHNDGTVETVFYSQDSIYKITFDKPLELELFYTWVDQSDNSCSDVYKYRFSKKGFPIHKESGWIKTGPFPDSAYNLTLFHVNHFRCKSDQPFNPNLRLQSMLQKERELGQTMDTLFTEITNINGLDYLIIGGQKSQIKYKNNYLTQQGIGASTIIDSNWIEFSASCLAKDCDGFIEKMEKAFKTMRIEHTPRH